MKGSLENASTHSLISRFSRSLAVIGIAAAATFSAAMPVYAEDWQTLSATPYFLYGSPDSDDNTVDTFSVAGVFDEINKSYGLNENDTSSFLYWSNTAHMYVESDCTYKLTFKLLVTSTKSSLVTPLPDTFGTITFTDSLPTTWNELGHKLNSVGKSHSSFVEHSGSYNKISSTGEENITFTYVFSTAQGYIDNVAPGNYYVNFLNSDQDIFSEYGVTFFGVSIEAVFDPLAEYYQKLVISNLDKKGDEFTEIGSKQSEHENWALDKAAELHAEASEQMGANLDLAKSFMQTSTFASGSGSSIAASAAAFGAIYNQVLDAVPPELQALVVIIPTLAFIGWVVGRVQ